MKNLHIIPTDKPSRLFLNKVNNKLLLDSDTYCDLIKRLPSSNYQNLYITNDEEIKEGDYYYNERLNQVYQAIRKLGYNTVDREFKVILTTDLRLAPDVQKIDDEFLEWFVKNPSCEGVEVADLWKDGNPSTHFSYQIIIPQEESNPFELPKVLPDDVFFKSLEEPKQETLEEAAHNYFIKGQLGFEKAADTATAFLRGGLWQAERMYSEEEVLSIIDKAFHMYASSHRYDAKEWFEENKKK
jgi:hypothetical protein